MNHPSGVRSVRPWFICFNGIIVREAIRFSRQKARFIASLVRPLVWLFIFAAGFRQVLGVSIAPPYETYVLYETYIIPGLIGMIQLFSGMQNSLSMVHDRETGTMRTLLISPFPRWYLLAAKLSSGVAVSLSQVAVFLAIAWVWGIRPPPLGFLAVIPALICTGFLMGSFGLLIASTIRQLENFAGVMNFVIFPMFFASSALFPLWRVNESSPLLYDICRLNPFTYSVELIRFALYNQLNTEAAIVVGVYTLIFFSTAVFFYRPTRSRRNPKQQNPADSKDNP